MKIFFLSLSVVSLVASAQADPVRLHIARPEGRATHEHPGIAFLRGSRFSFVDKMSRTELVPQANVLGLTGQVVDGHGQPVPQAYVTVSAPYGAAVVRADERGIFALLNFPPEGVTILASNGRGFGQTKIEKDVSKVEVVLQETANDPVTSAQAAALADDILPTARLGTLTPSEWERYWDILGAERMEAMVARRNLEQTWVLFIESLIQRQPNAVLARADELLAHVPNRTIDVGAQVARLRVGSGDPAQHAKAQTWLEAQSRPSLGMTAASVTILLHIATVAEALQAGGSTKWLDFAAQIAGQLKDKDRAATAWQWGKVAAPLGATALANLTQEWDRDSLRLAYQGAFIALLDSGDEKSAAAMLKQMEMVFEKPQAREERPSLKIFHMWPQLVAVEARMKFAALQSRTDAPAALQLIPDNYDDPIVFLEIARNMVKQGHPEMATPLLRRTSKAKSLDGGLFHQAAQLAASFDSKLSEELCQKVWERTFPKDGTADGYKPSIALYAEARAQDWPGESRVLIEREWAQRLLAFKADDKWFVEINASDLKNLVGAMATISPRRALEMAEQLPPFRDTRAEGRGRIAVKLLERN